ncbi:Uncharacterised protein [Mycobacteroides abscessus]|nr:Uncharacterised protein [Mycobacteroides abscessus]
MIAAPARMNAPRRTSATMIPTMRTRCCCSRGTAKRAMMMTNTNRLSTERLYSVSHPA